MPAAEFQRIIRDLGVMGDTCKLQSPFASSQRMHEP